MKKETNKITEKGQRFYIGNKRIFMTKAEVTNSYHSTFIRSSSIEKSNPQTIIIIIIVNNKKEEEEEEQKDRNYWVSKLLIKAACAVSVFASNSDNLSLRSSTSLCRFLM